MRTLICSDPGDIVSVDWAGLAFLNLANVASHPLTARLTIGAVDDVAGFRRLVADSPNGGREFSDSIDGKIGQARRSGHRMSHLAWANTNIF